VIFFGILGYDRFFFECGRFAAAGPDQCAWRNRRTNANLKLPVQKPRAAARQFGEATAEILADAQDGQCRGRLADSYSIAAPPHT